jgi:hypothetical protein
VIRTNENGLRTYPINVIAEADYGGMPKRLSKNAIPHSDTGFTIAFLATANEDA